ncbi:class I SAM-dependent methyltransferase [Devosia sp.]|uniref:class I SAM-dependent methyltransferase n=1 Tax=Devosia sp. TaxID=1871048 RepID=UPI003A953F05
MSDRPDAETIVRTHLKPRPLPSLPGLSAYLAHSGSRLSRLERDEAPYWAYAWAGGLALALYVQDHPETVAGKAVLDFGSGCGLVGISAAKAGAAKVYATDLDPLAIAATTLNAELNGVAITVLDPADPLPRLDLVLAGDVHYHPDVATTATAALDGFLAQGIEVLVGDPHRADLPQHRLCAIADLDVPDFGAPGGTTGHASVFSLIPA